MVIAKNVIAYLLVTTISFLFLIQRVRRVYKHLVYTSDVFCIFFPNRIG